MKISGFAAALALTGMAVLPSFAADTKLPSGKPAGTKQAQSTEWLTAPVVIGGAAVIAIIAVVASQGGDNDTVTPPTTTGTAG